MHMTQLMPLPLTVSCFSKIQIGFIPFWYRPSWVVLEKGPLNGRVCVRHVHVRWWRQAEQRPGDVEVGDYSSNAAGRLVSSDIPLQTPVGERSPAADPVSRQTSECSFLLSDSRSVPDSGGSAEEKLSTGSYRQAAIRPATIDDSAAASTATSSGYEPASPSRDDDTSSYCVTAAPAETARGLDSGSVLYHPARMVYTATAE